MTDPCVLPAARERNRHGVRPLLWTLPPASEEAFIDKLELRLTGSVRSLRNSEEDIQQYGLMLSTGSHYGGLDAAYRLFGTGHWMGGKFVVSVLRGETSVSGGQLALHRRGASAGIELSLTVNPTRTLEHLLARYDLEDIIALPPSDFFRLSEEVRSRGETLDRSDNMISDPRLLGGTAYAARIANLRAYLRTYEAALRGLVLDQLCPREQGFNIWWDGRELVGASPEYEVRLRWGEVSLVQCEVYWERLTRHESWDAGQGALSFVDLLAKRALAAARDVRVFTYGLPDGASVEREEGALSVHLPLNPSGSIVLATYAKAEDRVRFEVRYLRDLPQRIRDEANGRAVTGGASAEDKLFRLLEAACEEAARRVPWSGFRALLEPAPPAGVAELLRIAEALQRACIGREDRFRPLLETLLVTGGVSATGEDGPAPDSILDQLIEAGLIEHVRLVRREARDGGRRYRLTSRYMAVSSAFGPPQRHPASAEACEG